MNLSSHSQTSDASELMEITAPELGTLPPGSMEGMLGGAQGMDMHEMMGGMGLGVESAPPEPRAFEWRIFLPNTPINASRISALLGAVASSSVKVEPPRCDKYFVVPTAGIGVKLAERNGVLSPEIKTLAARCSKTGAERWAKVAGEDLSQYSRLPIIGLRKSRTQYKQKGVKGLKQLEVTQVEVLEEGHPGCATVPVLPQHRQWLTLCVEGKKPKVIMQYIRQWQLDTLADVALRGSSMVVSYPAFLGLLAQLAPGDQA